MGDINHLQGELRRHLAHQPSHQSSLAGSLTDEQLAATNSFRGASPDQLFRSCPAA